MKLHILSDLHFEFQKWPRGVDVNAVDADVTILAGDIGIGLQGIQWALDRIERPVIYVMGNHEYFGQRPITRTLEKAKRKCAGTHVHVLDNESVIIDGVRFLGTTLWTDFALFGIEQRDTMMAHAQSTMTDYALIHATRKGRLTEPGVSLRHLGDRITPRTTSRSMRRHDVSWKRSSHSSTVLGATPPRGGRRLLSAIMRPARGASKTARRSCQTRRRMRRIWSR